MAPKLDMKIRHLLLTFLILALPAAKAQENIVTTIAPVPGSKVPEEKDLAAYLLVYFADETHSLYMALSHDSYSFTALNDGKPVLDGHTLAEQKGVRDVHIMRGPDNGFYLSMTDLHIFAQKEGLRPDLWERPGNIYGWGNNRALILMKSYDLINWTHSDFRLDQAFPELKDIGCAWAPETIWDPEKNQPMIYFTMRILNGQNQLYYSYTDNDFTKLETLPQLLFEHPRNLSCIDGDITKVGDKYHLFYKEEGRGGCIRQAISDKLTSGYVFDPAKVDPEHVAAEAPNLFKRNGTDTYVLMYDVFGARPHTMGFSETTDFVHFTDLGHFNQGVMKSTNFNLPKHGAVISLTEQEADALAAHWNLEKF
jgi:hypothetical protein